MRLQFGIQVCFRCSKYRGDTEIGTARHLKIVDQTIKRLQNRLTFGFNFLATLFEAFYDERNSEKAKQFDKVSTHSDIIEGLQLNQPSVFSHTL